MEVVRIKERSLSCTLIRSQHRWKMPGDLQNRGSVIQFERKTVEECNHLNPTFTLGLMVDVKTVGLLLAPRAGVEFGLAPCTFRAT